MEKIYMDPDEVFVESYEISGDELANNIRLMFSAGSWYQMHKILFMFMDIDCAAYLCFLIGLSERLGILTSNEGWFFHTSEQIYEDLTFEKQTVERLTKELRNLGFIRTERRGIPSKLYYRVNSMYIYRLVAEVGKQQRAGKTKREIVAILWQQIREKKVELSPELTKPLSLVDCKPIPLVDCKPIPLVDCKPIRHTIYEKELGNTVGISEGSSIPNILGKKNKEEPSDKDSSSLPGKEFAQLLDKGLQKTRMSMRKSNIPKWSARFTRLLQDMVEIRGYTLEESIPHIRFCLDYYIAHIHDRYMPQMYCGDSFCDKFMALERAIVKSLPDESQDSDDSNDPDNFEQVRTPLGNGRFEISYVKKKKKSQGFLRPKKVEKDSERPFDRPS